MKKIFQKIAEYIGKSILGKDGKVSSSRMSSYFILGSIILTSILFVVIELVNAIILWKTGMPYTIPSEHIVIFGMVLAHHLTLLGINKNAETKVEQAVQDKLKSLNTLNPKDIDTEAPPIGVQENFIPGGEENEEDMV